MTDRLEHEHKDLIVVMRILWNKPRRYLLLPLDTLAPLQKRRNILGNKYERPEFNENLL